MRAGMRLALGILVAVAGTLCWSQAMLRSGQAAGNTGYRLRLEPGPPLTDSQLERLEEDPNPYLLVRESSVVAQAPLFSRRREMTTFSFAGNPALLFSGNVLIQGAWPLPDSDGCAVDIASARALWGDEASALGQTLTLDSREYTVTGLLDLTQPAMAFPRPRGEEFSPTLVAYRPSGEALFPRQELDSFLGGQQLTASSTANLGRTATLLRGLALLPAWLFCMLIAHACLRSLLPGGWLPRWIALGVAGFGVGRLMGFPNLLFPELLPTRWSDFSFWSEHLRTARESLVNQLLLPGTLPDLVFLQGVAAPTAAWSAAALACYLVAFRYLRAAILPRDPEAR